MANKDRRKDDLLHEFLWKLIDGVLSIPATISGTFAVTNAVLTDVHNAVSHYLKVNIQNASIAVTGTFWQATQPVSIAADVGVKGLKALGNGTNETISSNPTAVAVPAGAETATIENKSTTATMYIGTVNNQGATGPSLPPGITRHNYPVTGLTNIYVHSTVLSEVAGVQFYGRS